MTAFKNLFNGASTKFLAALLGAGVQAVVNSGHFDWKVFAAGVLTAAGVYLFPNKTP